MRRARLLLAPAVLAAAVLAGGGAAPAQPACTISWDGGGPTDSWHTAANWNTDVVPGPADHVCIAATPAVTVTHSSGTTQILTLTTTDTVLVTAGTLALTDTSETSSAANFRLAGGALAGAGTLSVTGTLTWTGGTMRDAGTTRIEAAATLAHNGSVSIQDGRLLENAGRLEFQGAGWIDDLGTPPLIHNTGTIEKTSAAASTATIFAPLDNDGSVRSGAGVLSLQGASGSVASDGDFGAPAAAGVVRFDAGTFALADGSALLGGVDLSGSTVAVATGATAVASAANSFSSGILEGLGTLEITGTLAWTGGGMRGAGTTRIGPTGAIEHDGSVTIQDGRLLENAGRLEFQGAGWIDDLGTAPLLRNTATGTIEKTSAAASTATIFAPLDNDGSVRSGAGVLSLQGASGSVASDGDFGAPSAAGVVRFDAGTFELADGSALLGGVDLSGSTVAVAPGATAVASAANSFSSGNLEGLGTLEITGTLAWTGGGMRGAGTTRIGPTGAIEHDGSVTIQDGRLLENAGRLEFQGAGWIDDLGTAPLLRNTATGTIEKSSTDPTATIFAPFENDGAIASSSGVLSLQGGDGTGTSAGAFGESGAAGLVRFALGTFDLANGASLLGGVKLDGGTLNVVPGATVAASGANTFSAGVIGGLGTLNVSGTLTWTGGTMRDGGITRITAAGTVLHAGPAVIQDGRLLQNAGRLEFRGAGWIDDLGTPPLLHNTSSGTVEKTSVDPTATIFAPFDNDGAVRSSAGTLSLQGGDGLGSSAGDFGAPGAAGTVMFDNGTFDLAAGAELLGGARLDGATLTVSPGVTTTASGENRFSGGTLGGAGTLDVTGTLIWTQGTMREAGITRIAQGATLAVEGFVAVQDTRVLENAGRVEVRGDHFISNVGGTALVHNAGAFEKTTGAGTSFLTVPIDNDGTVEADTGILRLTGGDGAAVQSGVFGGPGPGKVAFGSGTYDLGAGTGLAGGVRIEGGRLTVPEGVTVPASGANEFLSGAIDGAGTFRIDGPFAWSGGTMEGVGRTLVPAGSELRLTSACCPSLSGARRLVNEGTIVVDGGTLSADENTRVENSARIELAGGDQSEGFVGLGRLANAGAIVKTAGPDPSDVSMELVNAGTVESAAGRLTLGSGDGDAAQSGTFGATGGGEVVFAGGDWDLGPGSRFTGGVAIEVATVSVPAGYTLPVAGAARLAEGSQLRGGGTVEIQGSLTWTGGLMADGGLTVIAPGAVLTLDGEEDFSVHDLSQGRRLVNRGTITWVDGRLESFEASVLNEGTIDFQGDGSFEGGGASLFSTLVHNTGTIRKSGGAGESTLNLAVDNDGTLEAASGTLALRGLLMNYSPLTKSLTAGAYVARNATLELPGQQPLEVNAATVVLDGSAARMRMRAFPAATPVDALRDLLRNAGAGELRLQNGAELETSGPLRNLGLVTVGPDGTLRVGGAYLQTGGLTELTDASSLLEAAQYVQTGGRLAIEAAPAGVGRLNVAGVASLGGTLAVDTSAGFVPAPGAAFRFLQAGSRTGTFGSVLEVAPGIDYEIDYDATGAVARVAGAPVAPVAVPVVRPREPAVAPLPALFPLDDRGLSKLSGPWTRKSSAGFYEGTYTVSSRRGAMLIRAGVEARYLGVLVSTCRGCGTLEVYWDGRLLRRVKLAGKPSRRLVDLITFPSARTGTVTLRVSSSRRQVRIDGLVAAE